ncbi:MAG: threonylcarbamoyl-AMP synthase [Betaproteobacteria bacterium HGW-Betaproteobacteria-22]|nr:MAG: threonylcarbamoyl-AMP synthase [Betaproteobacteria bacterium HGW-Betaproteobacteria-22]
MRICLEQAIARLKHGEVVAIPTETVYGLAADATNDSALKKIFEIKQRPADHPLIVHIGDISQVENWAACFPETARRLAACYWPGPLTIVLPAKESVSRVVRGGESTVALRVPDHPVALALLQQSALSLAAPSANLFTQLSPTTVEHVEKGLGDAIPVLDGGACQVGIESTIVSVTASGQWQVLRPGVIGETQIAKMLNQPDLSQNPFSQLPKVPEILATDLKSTPRVPGQHALHYSPLTPLLLFKQRDALIQCSQALSAAHLTYATLMIGEGLQPQGLVIRLPNQPDKVAEQLYDTLHRLDALKLDRLLVALPPSQAQWSAVSDRLSRAGQVQD